MYYYCSFYCVQGHAAHLERMLRHKSKERTVKKLQGELRAKGKALEALQTAFKDLKGLYTDAFKDAKTAADDNKRLRRDLKAARKEARGAGSNSDDDSGGGGNIRDMAKKLDFLSDRVKSAKEELRAARDREEDWRRERRRLKESLREAEAALEDNETRDSDAAKSLAKYQREARRMRDEIAELKKELDVARRGGGRKLGGAKAKKKGAGGGGGEDYEDDFETEDFAGESSSSSAAAAADKRRIKVLEAQIAALRSERAADKKRAAVAAAAARAKATSTSSSAAASRRGEAGGDDGGVSPSVVGKTRAAWEAEKKLRRRADRLASRLEERARELEASRKTADSLRTQLQRAQREKTLLEAQRKRQGSAGRGFGGGGSVGGASATTAAEALRAWKDTASLRSRIDELEAAVAAARKRADVEQPAAAAALQQEKEAAEEEAARLRKECQRLRSRARALESELAGGGGDRSIGGIDGDDEDVGLQEIRRQGRDLRGAEARYIEEDRLREQLSECQLEVSGAEEERERERDERTRHKTRHTK